MYRHTKNELSTSKLSKVTARTGQTDRRTNGPNALPRPHLQVVITIVVVIVELQPVQSELLLDITDSSFLQERRENN